MIKKLSEVPEGVKVLAFVFFVGALLTFAFGVMMFSASDGIRVADPILLVNSGLAAISFWIFLLAGILLIGLGVFEYFVGKGLLESKTWARNVVGVLSILGILFAILNVTTGAYASGLFGVVLNGLIAWYLFANKETKKFFK
jgi:hypothetical protein